MTIYLLVLLAVLNTIALKGSKMLLALYASDRGVDLFSIGILASLYGLFPLVLAVYAGKVSDRLGTRLPMLLGSFGLALGMALPYFVRHLYVLYVSTACISLGYIFFQVAVHNRIGALGDAEARVRNFGVFSLGGAVSGFFGPVFAGFGMDHFGAPASYLLLGLCPLAAGVCLLIYKSIAPAEARAAEPRRDQSVMDFVRNAALRRILITSGVILTGIDLYTFYFPIYGRSIGLSASVIGVVLSMQAVAAFVVRVLMPRLVKQWSEETVLTYSLYVASVTYVLFPLFHNVVILGFISFVLGFALGCGQPLSIILTYNRSPAGRSGEALGVRLMVNKLTQVAVPLIFGAVGATFGLLPVFWSNALFLMTGGRLTAKRSEPAG